MIVFEVITILFVQLIISSSALPTKNDVSGVRKAFSLADVTSDTFVSELKFNGTWISDTEIFYSHEDQLLKYDVVKKAKEIISRNNVFNESCDCYPSPDGSYVLMRNVTQNIYRHSTLSTFRIHNVIKNVTISLADNQLLSTAFWAPRGNSLVYVLNNDIYYYQLIDKSPKTRRLTFDGAQQAIYNGIPDWVYEEEVYSTNRAMWFSPTGEHLVFAAFDDNRVPEAVILKYGKPGSLKDQYPTEERFRYPKAGASNPKVTLNLVDLASRELKSVPLKAPTDVVGTDHIMYTAGWLDSKTIVATWTNRVQNLSQMVAYTLNGESNYLLKQTSPGGWLINPEQIPIIHEGYAVIIKLQPVDDKSQGLFSHVTRFTLVNGSLVDEIDLTPGGIWVHRINGVNGAKRVVSFTASPPGEPGKRILFEVGLDGDKRSLIGPKCVSCGYRSAEGNECKYVSSVSFSSNNSHYALTCEGPDPTSIEIYGSKNFHNWSRNDTIRRILAERKEPKIIDLYVESHGFNSKVRLMLPEDFDEKKKYPMLVNVYAGPNSQQIYDKFVVNFGTYMTSKNQVIQASIDGRGSSARGTAMMYAVYRNLGGAEIDDQITVTKKLQEKFSWIDSSRTGIWGWSYGGYATARALTKDEDNVFKCGISVAPVTDWIYYDSIYTERYMALPTTDDNSKGYNTSSVINFVEKFRGKKYMLVHGTGDDNVHFQQSMALNRALAEADILYDQLSYPDEAHSLIHVSKHLYHTMDRFWAECFGYE